MQLQQTLREKISISGVGLHGGQQLKLELLGAPVDSGITFVRTDLPRHAELRACVANVVDTQLATTLAVGQGAQAAVVGTVEHLLAAFAGMGIDNAQVLIDGPELPILDGSAQPFVEMIERVGIEKQNQARKVLFVKKELRLRDGDKEARIGPGPELRITCSLDFDHPLISNKAFRYDACPQRFAQDIAPARTFGFLRDVEALKAAGLGLGGSLDNAVVIDAYRVLNPEGLRFADEFVRHKVLDAIGDLSLFGMAIAGRVHLHRSGHAMNTALVQAVLQDPRNYEIRAGTLSTSSADVEQNSLAMEYLETAKGIA